MTSLSILKFSPLPFFRVSVLTQQLMSSAWFPRLSSPRPALSTGAEEGQGRLCPEPLRSRVYAVEDGHLLGGLCSAENETEQVHFPSFQGPRAALQALVLSRE